MTNSKDAQAKKRLELALKMLRGDISHEDGVKLMDNHEVTTKDLQRALQVIANERQESAGAIKDVSGYCPVGCGATLHLMAGNLIQCLARNCIRPGAAQELLLDNEVEHVIEFGEKRFTTRHPLRERLDDALLKCEVDKYISGLPRCPVKEPGKYKVYRLRPNGAWIYESIE